MDTIETPVAPKTSLVPVLRSQMSVPTSKLMPGMFVVALDRPWEGTPFLLQGFLIDEVEQLRMLREMCQQVVIDPRRSDAHSLRDLTNLYILPEDIESDDEGEPTIRVRYLETNRTSFVPPAKKNFSLATMRAGVANGLKELLDGPTDTAAVLAARQAEARAAADAASVSLPRFASTQVFYASTTTQASGSASPSRPARLALARESRPHPAARNDEDAKASAELLARFEALIHGLQPDWSAFVPGLGLLRRLFARLGRPPHRRPPPRRRPIVRRPASRREPSIPRSIDLVIYRDRTTIESEVPRAREAVTSAEDMLGQLRADLTTESTVRVEGLPSVVDSLVESVKRNPDALIWVARVRTKDSMTYTHSIKVASYLLSFGRHLGFPAEQLAQLAQIGMLMDIGKLDVDSEILNKREALTGDEFEQVKEHVELGLERLAESTFLDKAVRDGIAQHHEWINGEGYPKGLQGEAISIFGRMAAIVDAYAALTTPRPYAPALSSYEALQVIYSQAGKKFHGPLVEQFVRAIGLFPVGSLVLLSTEEVAVVTAHDKTQRLEPRVLVLTTPFKHGLPRPYELDLMRRPKDDKGKPIRILRSLPAGVHGIDFRNFYIA